MALPGRSQAGIAALLPALILSVITAQAQSITPEGPLEAKTIQDGYLGMPAGTTHIPQGWHFEAARLPEDAENFVFRAYSSDGLSEMRIEPSYSWRDVYSTQQVSSPQWTSAADFAGAYATHVVGARIIGPMAVGDQFQWQWQHHTDRSYTVSTAALRVESNNGAFTIEQRIRVRVGCTRFPLEPLAEGYIELCGAVVDVLRAPKERFEALVNYMDAHGLPEIQADEAWNRRNVEVMKKVDWLRLPVDPPSRATLRKENVTNREKSYQDATLLLPAGSHALREDGYDWADHALALIDSYAGHPPTQCVIRTWARPDGQHYSTANPEANPNGALPGPWNLQHVDRCEQSAAEGNR